MKDIFLANSGTFTLLKLKNGTNYIHTKSTTNDCFFSMFVDVIDVECSLLYEALDQRFPFFLLSSYKREIILGTPSCVYLGLKRAGL